MPGQHFRKIPYRYILFTMTRESILIILGVLVAISPWSGVPLAWLAWFLLPAGLVIAVIAYTLRARVAGPAQSVNQDISTVS